MYFQDFYFHTANLIKNPLLQEEQLTALKGRLEVMQKDIESLQEDVSIFMDDQDFSSYIRCISNSQK